MDATTRSIIDKVTVRYTSPQRLPSGHLCTVFYDCRQLSPNDLARLAAQATGDLDEGTFDAVVGIAYSGILFAAAVARGCQVVILQKDGMLAGPSVKDKKVMIVDDVVHSGAHLRAAREIVEHAGGVVIGYACIVDRSEGAAPEHPLYSAYQALPNEKEE